MPRSPVSVAERKFIIMLYILTIECAGMLLRRVCVCVHACVCAGERERVRETDREREFVSLNAFFAIETTKLELILCLCVFTYQDIY